MGHLIDELDAQIIRQLQVDGRLANTEIARRLGVSEGTVRKRIERLISRKVMQIGAWADPLQIGYQHYAVMEIGVMLPKIDEATRRLAGFPEVFFLGICMGGFEIFVTALFRSNEHMHEFMTKRLAKVPGIQRTATLSVTRIIKRVNAVPVPVSKVSAIGKRTKAKKKKKKNDPR